MRGMCPTGTLMLVAKGVTTRTRAFFDRTAADSRGSARVTKMVLTLRPERHCAVHPPRPSAELCPGIDVEEARRELCSTASACSDPHRVLVPLRPVGRPARRGAAVLVLATEARAHGDGHAPLPRTPELNCGRRAIWEEMVAQSAVHRMCLALVLENAWWMIPSEITDESAAL